MPIFITLGQQTLPWEVTLNKETWDIQKQLEREIKKSLTFFCWLDYSKILETFTFVYFKKREQSLIKHYREPQIKYLRFKHGDRKKLIFSEREHSTDEITWDLQENTDEPERKDFSPVK